MTTNYPPAFMKMAPEKLQSFTCGISGHSFTGKTELGLTFPKPVAAAGFDRPLEAPINSMIKRKLLAPEGDVVYANLLVTGQSTDLAMAYDARSKFEQMVAWIKSVGHGTLLIDGAKGFQDVITLAELEGKSGVGRTSDGGVAGFGYRKVNNYYRNLFAEFSKSPIFLVWTAPLGRVYVDGQPTNKWEPDWWKYTADLCDVVIAKFTDPPMEDFGSQDNKPTEGKVGKDTRFLSRVAKFAPDQDYRGYVAENLTFADLSRMAFGEVLV